MQPGTLPRPGAQRRGRRKQKKKDIFSDVLLGALEEIRTPDLLIRSQTLYPTELPAQVQDIYYHRPRGLSTVFAKKFKIFSRSKKRFFCPPSGGGRRAFFSAADSPPAPPCVQGCACTPCGVLCARGCPRAACGVPCTLRCPPCALRCPPCALWCPCALWDALCALWCGVSPARPGMPCALCGVLRALGCPPCALGCPVRSGMPRAPWDVLCALECPRAACGAPMRPAMPPCALAVPPARPGATLHAPRCPARLRQPCGASRPAIQSASLPRPAAVLSPAPPHGREKARPLQKERPGLVHFAVRR